MRRTTSCVPRHTAQAVIWSINTVLYTSIQFPPAPPRPRRCAPITARRSLPTFPANRSPRPAPRPAPRPTMGPATRRCGRCLACGGIRMYASWHCMWRGYCAAGGTTRVKGVEGRQIWRSVGASVSDEDGVYGEEFHIISQRFILCHCIEFIYKVNVSPSHSPEPREASWSWSSWLSSCRLGRVVGMGCGGGCCCWTAEKMHQKGKGCLRLLPRLLPRLLLENERCRISRLKRIHLFPPPHRWPLLFLFLLPLLPPPPLPPLLLWLPHRRAAV